MVSDLFLLTDEQMARLQPFFPKSHGRPRVDDSRVLSGIIFINRNGLQWRDAPREYGPAKTLYNRWERWSDKGVFLAMMDGLSANRLSVSRRSRRNRHVLAMSPDPSPLRLQTKPRPCSRLRIA